MLNNAFLLMKQKDRGAKRDEILGESKANNNTWEKRVLSTSPCPHCKAGVWSSVHCHGCTIF
jgi:hypothetical protein